MKTKILAILGGILIFEALVLAFVWASPMQRSSRARISTRTPYPTELPPGVEVRQWTPIPTLYAATLPAPVLRPEGGPAGQGPCMVAALDLIGAWVQAGKPQAEPFPFTAADGKICQAAYAADVQRLFAEPNLWYDGAIACTTCHGAEVKAAPAGLSLVDYASVMAGSRRAEDAQTGTDILGDAQGWEKSILYIKVFTRQMPVGRPANAPQKGPVILAGTLK